MGFHAGVHRGVQGYRGITRGTQGYTGVTQGCTGVHWGAHGYPKLNKELSH